MVSIITFMLWFLEYNGTVKLLSDWKITGTNGFVVSQGEDEISFSCVEDMNAPQQFQYDAKGIIYQQPNHANPQTRVKWFEGWFDPAEESFSGVTRRNYKLSNVWRWFERLPYQKVWYKAIDPTGATSALIGGWRSEVILNMGANGALQTVEEQIQEIVDYVNAVAVLQGTSTGDILQLSAGGMTVRPAMKEKDNITCAEALREELKWVPGAVVRFDYSTTPPTMFVEVPATTHTVSISSRTVGTIKLKPRHDRAVDRVRLKFKQQNRTDGVTWIYDLWSIYPAPPSGSGGTFLAPAVGGGYYFLTGGGAIVHETPAPTPIFPLPPPAPAPPPENTFGELLLSMDLVGWQLQYARATITTMQWGAVAWLQRKLPFLNPSTGAVIRGTPRLVKLIYQNGDVYDPLNPGNVPAPPLLNDVLHGSLVDGLRFSNGDYVLGEQYTAVYEISHATTIGGLASAKTGDIQTIKFTATNAASGSYSGLKSSIAGDPIPTELAQALYEGLHDLQHDGTVQLKSLNIGQDKLLGKNLTLTGGNPAHVNMRIQAVQFSLDNNDVTVSVGVPKHLSAGDMVALLQVARTRARWTAPDTVTTGRGAGAADGATPTHTSADNSVGSQSVRGVDSWSGKAPDPTTGVIPALRMEAGVDATNGVFRLLAVGPTDQAPRPDYAQEVVQRGAGVVLDLVEAEDKELRIRDLTVHDDNGNTTVVKYVASADAEAAGGGGGTPVWL